MSAPWANSRLASAPCNVLRCPASRRCNSATLVAVCWAAVERCQCSSRAGGCRPGGSSPANQPGAAGPDAAAPGAAARCPNGSDQPAAPPTRPTSHRCVARPQRCCSGRGRMTPDHPPPGVSGAGARPRPAACGRCRARRSPCARSTWTTPCPPRSTLRSRPARPVVPYHDAPTPQTRRSGPQTRLPTATRPAGPLHQSSGAAHHCRPWPPASATHPRRLKPGLALTPEVPAPYRVERPRPQILGFLRRQMFPHPRLAQR